VKPVPFILPPPDLVVEGVAASGEGICVKGRRTFTMHVTVRNVGKGPAIMPNSQSNPWVGVHSTYSEGGGASGNPYPKMTGPAALQPGATFTLKVNLNVANPPVGKPYTVNAVVDPSQLIGESNEDNNMKGWIPSLAETKQLACPPG